MGKPVNLNRYRKTQARAKDKARADQNAVTFGLSKPEKELAKARAAKTRRDLDGHRDEDSGEE
ncbi:DUF4169 family protein [Pseudophaeobacter leonis]|uniref:DUF4169 family protein n=1 Tax=Pseudophaeobacter leonis TaxID=1144477 RepID=UPI0009F1EAB8|nr:DUF4169 family protein [Pseudophaeobacter leonis]